jgi:hypothetical protein
MVVHIIMWASIKLNHNSYMDRWYAIMHSSGILRSADGICGLSVATRINPYIYILSKHCVDYSDSRKCPGKFNSSSITRSFAKISSIFSNAMTWRCNGRVSIPPRPFSSRSFPPREGAYLLDRLGGEQFREGCFGPDSASHGRTGSVKT